MSSEYRRKHVQAPPSYDELTSNRPTKKRVFKYSITNDNAFDRIAPLSSHRTRIQPQDFSFEGSQSPHKTQETIVRRYPLSRQDEGREEQKEEKVYDSSPTKQLAKKYEIDERLNNIASINDKISGLLNAVRNKKTENFSIITSFREGEISDKRQKNENFNVSYNSFNSDEEAYRQKVREALRAKYNLKLQTDSNVQAQNTKLTPQRSSLMPSPSESDKRQKTSQADKVVQDKPPIVTAFRSRPSESQNPPLSEVNPNMRLANEKRQKVLMENLILDRQIQEKKQKIFADSPFNPKVAQKQPETYSTRKDQRLLSPSMPKLTEKPEVLKLAESLSKLIEVDIIMFKYRESFQACRDSHKWAQLMSQLHARDLYLEEKEVKQMVSISIHEKNPFTSGKSEYTLNQSKDLAKLMAEAQRIWNEEIEKCVSLDGLAEDGFSMAVIDFSSKGTISLEDLVCFVNLNSQKFYRSREAAGIFKRFLKLESKTLDRAVSGGLSYSTFMEKVARA